MRKRGIDGRDRERQQAGTLKNGSPASPGALVLEASKKGGI